MMHSNASQITDDDWLFCYRTQSGWTEILKKVKPNTNFVLNLEPATSYVIRVDAHNVAGTTLVEYEVSTLPLDLGLYFTILMTCRKNI